MIVPNKTILLIVNLFCKILCLFNMFLNVSLLNSFLCVVKMIVTNWGEELEIHP